MSNHLLKAFMNLEIISSDEVQCVVVSCRTMVLLSPGYVFFSIFIKRNKLQDFVSEIFSYIVGV